MYVGLFLLTINTLFIEGISVQVGFNINTMYIAFLVEVGLQEILYLRLLIQLILNAYFWREHI